MSASIKTDPKVSVFQPVAFEQPFIMTGGKLMANPSKVKTIDGKPHLDFGNGCLEINQ